MARSRTSLLAVSVAIAVFFGCDATDRGGRGGTSITTGDASMQPKNMGLEAGPMNMQENCGKYAASYTPAQCSQALSLCLAGAPDEPAKQTCYSNDPKGEDCRRCVLDSGYECFNDAGCSAQYDAWLCCVDSDVTCNVLSPESCASCAAEKAAYDTCSTDVTNQCLTAGTDCIVL